jgi:pimeloyl-[acyl-carrier protein] methyl ester esterase
MTPIHWLLLPGLDGSGELFRWFLPYVAVERKKVVSYPANASWTLEDYVDHVQVGLASEQPCIVIAESFSGPIALRLLQRNANIVGLVLVASFITCPHPVLKVLPLSLWARMRSVALSETLLRLLCLGRDATAERLEVLKNVTRAIPTDVLGARLGVLRRLDETSNFRRARVPILSVVAAQDRLVMPGSRPQHQPNTQTAVIEGPHFLLQTHPSQCWRTIDTWSRAQAHAHD